METKKLKEKISSKAAVREAAEKKVIQKKKGGSVKADRYEVSDRKEKPEQDMQDGISRSRKNNRRDAIPIPYKDVRRAAQAAGRASKFQVRMFDSQYEDDEDLQSRQEAFGAELIQEAAACSPAHRRHGAGQKPSSRRYHAGKKRAGKPEDNLVTRADIAMQEKRFQKQRLAGTTHAVFENVLKNDLWKRAVKRAGEAVARNSLFIFIAAFIIIAIILMGNITGMFLEAAQTITENMLQGYSQASDGSITEADNYFSGLEENLRIRIENMETEKPGYDEYIYDLADIGHDPILLMAYLSSVYGCYDPAGIGDILDGLFSDMYRLEFTDSVENRDGREYKILTITLIKKEWEELMADRISTERRQDYETYIDFGGGHQAMINPFHENWAGKISSQFGWRIHPITGERKFHNGIDIAYAQGTEVMSCSSGTVIRSYYSESAGNYVVVRDESGYECHYMHLASRDVREGDRVSLRDRIGTVGSTGRSTGPHLHLGVKDAGGEWLNPIFMVQGGT